MSLLAACRPAVAKRGDTVASTTSDTASPGIEIAARRVVTALKARDGNVLAAHVHPTKGVRFTAYAFVRPESDVVLSPREIIGAFRDTTRRVWGHADGTGDPLHLSFDRYYERYVYDVDFASAPVVRLDKEPAHRGNTPSNLREAYPTARWVELHFPGMDPKYEGMDWRSLWLVFERLDRDWRLVGVVHGSWTI